MTNQAEKTKAVPAISIADEAIDRQTGGPGKMAQAMRNELYTTIERTDAVIKKNAAGGSHP